MSQKYQFGKLKITFVFWMRGVVRRKPHVGEC